MSILIKKVVLVVFLVSFIALVSLCCVDYVKMVITDPIPLILWSFGGILITISLWKEINLEKSLINFKK